MGLGLEARISRLLDRLEDSTLGLTEVRLIERKLELLQSLQDPQL